MINIVLFSFLFYALFDKKSALDRLSLFDFNLPLQIIFDFLIHKLEL